MGMPFEDRMSQIRRDELYRLRQENAELKEAKQLAEENEELRDQVDQKVVVAKLKPGRYRRGQILESGKDFEIIKGCDPGIKEKKP